MREPLEELRRHRTADGDRSDAGHRVVDRLREAAASAPVTPADIRAIAEAEQAPEAAVAGTATYFADLTAPRGERHVRLCHGTACFVASGGRHVAEVERALGVRVGECSPDGSVSLQRAHCLGHCYGGPAALDGDRPLAGPDLADQLAGRAAPQTPGIPVEAGSRPVTLAALDDPDPSWDTWRATVEEPDAADHVQAQVQRARLRGRGGAGYPAADKWSAVRRHAGPRYVVANGDEGDPGSYADRLLMERAPHAVLEGLALSGVACGAEHGFVYVRSEYPAAASRLREATEAAYAAGHLGRHVHGSRVSFDVSVVTGAGSYVAGEETSLLRSLAGLRGAVRPRPPYPTDQGYLGLPTAVNNVETLAAVPWVVQHGGAAYVTRGDPAETGTLLVCLNERFARPGVYEVDLGVPLRTVVEGLGGGLRDGLDLAVLQVGGPLGGFLSPDRLDLPLTEAALAAAGAALGHGSVVAVDTSIDWSTLHRHVWEFAARESCGACLPCRLGTSRGLLQAAWGEVDDDLLDAMATASLCAFGRGVPRAVRSLAAAYGRSRT